MPLSNAQVIATVNAINLQLLKSNYYLDSSTWLDFHGALLDIDLLEYWWVTAGLRPREIKTL